MPDAHRIHHDLHEVSKLIPDPGDGQTIYVTEDLQMCEMESGATGETRTLDDPKKSGIRVILRLKTDGGGDIAVTASNGFNVTGQQEANFQDASDLLSLISVETTTAGTFRWEIMEGNVGSVSLA